MCVNHTSLTKIYLQNVGAACMHIVVTCKKTAFFKKATILEMTWHMVPVLYAVKHHVKTINV